MNRFTFVLTVATLALAACGGNASSNKAGARMAQSNGVSFAVVFSPDPPKQGSEAIAVTLKDNSGNPIRGAEVTIAQNMPSMSMNGPTLTAKDHGDGTYVAQTNLNYATDWTFKVRAVTRGKTATASFSEQVK